MDSLEVLARWLTEADDVAVITHVHPDADALGTAMAIKLALTALGKRAACVCDDPAPLNYTFLPEPPATPEKLPFAPARALLVDAGDPDRAGRSGAILSQVPSATLDHHGTSRGVGEVRVVDPSAPAAGVLALPLIRLLGAPLTRDMAACLYAAIASDTGNFTFPSTTPQSLRAAADCLETGLELGEIAYRLFRARRPARTRLLGAALNAMELRENGRLAILRVTQDMLNRCGATGEDVDLIINYGVDTEGVVAAMLLEQRGDAVKLSLRSRGEFDVSALAASLGGGGHKNAAGATMEMTIEEAAEYVARKIKKILDEGESGGK